MLCGVMSSCSTIKGDNKGAIIELYLANELYNFDPALAYTDDTMVKVLSVMFEGLTRLDDDGDWEKAMMDSYKYEEDRGEFKLTVDLKSSKWSDGRSVQAADFVYAWKRQLDPEFRSDAASLLYEIKNARTAKFGDCSIDDVGITAPDIYTLQVIFEHDIDVDAFLRTAASVTLVPLREDVISRNAEHWAQKTTTIVCNGPFVLKELDYGKIMRLERNAYYFRDVEKDEQLDKYVIPWRLVTYYEWGDVETQYELFKNKEIFYLGEIPLDYREAERKNANVTDESATHTYLFNTNNPLFKDARVRRALSMAIDREEIANIVVYGKPATGLIPYGVSDANNKGDFRKTGGELISTVADVDGAKSLLREAGVTSGTFTITVKDNEQDLAVAEYVKGVWQGLGFNVMINALTGVKNRQLEKIYDDKFNEAYESGEFDVIAIDTNMITLDAFANLAMYSTEYSGGGIIDLRVSENYETEINRLGYKNADYDAIIDSAFNAEDSASRVSYLHDAEEKLLEDMPVCPMFFLQDYYLINSKVLSGEETRIEGYRDFSRMKMKNYVKYYNRIIAAQEAEAETANVD
jgi:ABC-type oligopeptide transport system substrate-binding subunit